ncbi:MAG: hypothetical protein PHH37_13255 [Paludibacter sp.]|nr:hypothetical protein [Paludibacter sp.]
MRKKILIVSRSFYPENSPRSFRTTELVKEFCCQGHDVTLLTNERNYDYSGFLKQYPVKIKYFDKLRFKRFQSKNNKGLFVDFPRKFGRLLFMLFNYPDIELLWLVKRALKQESGYDLMISVAVPYPVHWGVACGRSAKHIIANTWVADCGDPYYFNTLESFKIPFYFAWVEKWFSRKTDYISIPFESLLDSFFSEFHSKIKIIPQGFNFSEILISHQEPANEKVTFAYAGGVSSAGVRSPLKLIDKLLQSDFDFIFHIFATTGIDLVEKYSDLSGGRIVLHKAVPRTELLPFLSKMDFLVNLLVAGTETKQVPSKLIDYSLTGRPVINIDPLNPDMELIAKFLNKDYSKAYYVPDIEQYNIKNVANQFLLLAK